MADFSAVAPSLGYYYQIRFALHLMIENSLYEKDLVLEGIDDIVLISKDETNLFQSKYQLNGQGVLTDRSSDLWKTLRVWCEGIETKSINPLKTSFTIVTTGSCPIDSVIGKYILKEKNIRNTIEKLDAIASELTNQTNLKGYHAWSRQPEIIKSTILSNLSIADSSLDFKDIDNKVKSRVGLFISPQHVDSFHERLNGWWFGKCIDQLLDIDQNPIKFSELRQTMNELSSSFSLDTLPIDFHEPLEIQDDDQLSSGQEIFVKQLQLIAVNSKTLRNAISDYRRAFGQRGKWVREDLLRPSEEDVYEARIFDDWKALFDLMDANEDNQVNSQRGKAFYENFYIKRIPPLYIREKVRDSFLFRGSSHMLANRKIIGWHPKYEDNV